MKKCILFFAAIWMTLCFCSCDDGRIYEKEVRYTAWWTCYEVDRSFQWHQQLDG